MSWRPLDDAETPWFAHSYSVYLASRSWVNQLTYTTLRDGGFTHPRKARHPGLSGAGTINGS